MVSRKFIIIFFLLLSVAANAQVASEAFHVQWSIFSPLSDKEYIGKTSVAGMRFGYTKFLSERFGVGIEGGYNTLDDYIPRKTYTYPGGAYTTDFYNYQYYYTLMACGHYYFAQSDRVIPYASLAMGIAFNEYRIFYNVYETTDSQQGFVARPEVGVSFILKEYSRWGLKSSLSYEYAVTKSSSLEIDNLSGIGFQIGVVFFTD